MEVWVAWGVRTETHRRKSKVRSSAKRSGPLNVACLFTWRARWGKEETELHGSGSTQSESKIQNPQ